MRYAILAPNFRHPKIATHDADRLRAIHESGKHHALSRLRRLLSGWRT